MELYCLMSCVYICGGIFTRVSVWILPLILKHDGPLLCLGIRSFRK